MHWTGGEWVVVHFSRNRDGVINWSCHLVQATSHIMASGQMSSGSGNKWTKFRSTLHTSSRHNKTAADRLVDLDDGEPIYRQKAALGQKRCVLPLWGPGEMVFQQPPGLVPRPASVQQDTGRDDDDYFKFRGLEVESWATDDLDRLVRRNQHSWSSMQSNLSWDPDDDLWKRSGSSTALFWVERISEKVVTYIHR